MARRNVMLQHQQQIYNELSGAGVLDLNQLYQICTNMTEKGLIPYSKSFKYIYEFLIHIGLTVHVVSFRGRIVERYSINKPDTFQFAVTLMKNSFFSMTTALNLQGLANDRPEYIFISRELTKKNIPPTSLTQDQIDNAFKKPYRLTSNHGEFKSNYIVLLEPKYTKNYEIIDYNGYKMSSVNRAFVEMVVNVQYFKGMDKIVVLYKPLKIHLDLTKIYNTIKIFDFIYPYFQLFGYILEEIGFTKDELNSFKLQVGKFKFYTEKNKNKYLFNKYWQIYYTH